MDSIVIFSAQGRIQDKRESRLKLTVIFTHNKMKRFEIFPPSLRHKISRMKKKFSGLVVFNLF